MFDLGHLDSIQFPFSGKIIFRYSTCVILSRNHSCKDDILTLLTELSQSYKFHQVGGNYGTYQTKGMPKALPRVAKVLSYDLLIAIGKYLPP